jgi:putative tryptophan/tyrosine transport system substrate-binding protein
VFTVVGDPVGSGLVASLARPGGNVTGLSTQHRDAAGKRLELLREVLPSLGRLAIMANFGNSGALLELREAATAAGVLGIETVEIDIRRSEDLIPAFASVKGRADGLYVASDPLLAAHRATLNGLAWTLDSPAWMGLARLVRPPACCRTRRTSRTCYDAVLIM